MGPWDFFVLVQYPDIETAFRVLAKIGTLEVIKTETFPAEDVEIFLKALVERRGGDVARRPRSRPPGSGASRDTVALMGVRAVVALADS